MEMQLSSCYFTLFSSGPAVAAMAKGGGAGPAGGNVGSADREIMGASLAGYLLATGAPAGRLKRHEQAQLLSVITG